MNFLERTLTIILIATVLWGFWMLGFLGGRINIDRGAYYPDLGYGRTNVFIWKDGSIILYDNPKWTLENRDSVETDLKSKAIEFLKNN